MYSNTKEKLQKSCKEKFSKPVRITFYDETFKDFGSVYEVDEFYNFYKSYTSYRITGKRSLPYNWKSIEFLNK